MSSTRFDLTPLIDPRSIAIVGASNDMDRIGGLPIKLLIETGFEAVFPVNPKYDRIGPFTCYKSIEDLPHKVDLVILAVGAQDTLALLEQAHAKGIRAAILFASGFAETGAAAAVAQQQALVDFAQRTGMAIAGPNCVGITNFTKGVFATFARNFVPGAPVGRTALVGQSGNLASAIYRLARRGGVTFSHAINTGNEACLDLSSYLSYLADGDAIDAVLCYIEALKDGPAFLAAARRLREQGRLLAVYKSGSSDKGAEATQSHTGSLAGDRAAYAAAFREGGVAVAEDLAHLADLAYMHRFAGRKMGRRCGIVSVSGGAGAIIADELYARGFEVPTLSDDVQAALHQFIPSYGMVANPVDLTGNVANDANHVPRALGAILDGGDIDVMMLYLGGRSLERSMPSLAGLMQATDKLVVLIDTFGSGRREEVEAIGIPYFEEISQAVRAVTSYGEWALATPAAMSAPHPVVREIRAMADSFTASGRSALSETESKQLLAVAGVPIVVAEVVQDPQEAARAAAAIGFPVVMKLVSADVAHKTELGVVLLGIEDEAGVREGFATIMERARTGAPQARIDGVTVEPMIADGHELLVGAVRDPVFGWLLTVGMGGVMTELIGDVAHALLPVDASGAEALLRSLKTFALLDGYRGTPRCDVAAAAQAIANLSHAVLSFGPAVRECEINPLLVRGEGQGALAADALIILDVATSP